MMGLFSTTYIDVREAPRYPQTVNHHRAPTDKSVKLLREMEEAAWKSVVSKIDVQDNVVNGSVMVVRNRDREVVVLIFEINGKRYEATVPIDRFGVMLDREKAVRALVEAAVKEMVLSVLFEYEDVIRALEGGTR